MPKTESTMSKFLSPICRKHASFFLRCSIGRFRRGGDEYMSFNDGRLDGGFRLSTEPAPSTGVLLVFFSENLERDVGRVKNLGARISQEIFAFPGGRRFHFIDPAGTEYAMWAENSNNSIGE